MTTPIVPKVPVRLGDLRGPAGNAFAVLGQVHRSMKQVGTPPEEVSRFDTEAKSGDYEHLLDTVLEWCEDLDGSIAELRSGRDEDTCMDCGAPVDEGDDICEDCMEGE